LAECLIILLFSLYDLMLYLNSESEVMIHVTVTYHRIIEWFGLEWT